MKRTAQLAKGTGKNVVKAARLIAKVAAALVKGMVALLSACGPLVEIIVFIAAVALIASPFGIFFSDEDKSADVTPISNVGQEINAEFNQRIEDIKQAHSYVGSVEIHYPGSADNIRVDNWMDVVAVFAVKTATDTENGMDVVTIDTTRIDLIKTVFWDMNSIPYEIETIEHTETETIVHEDGTTSEETTTTYEYILHITITSQDRRAAGRRIRLQRQPEGHAGRNVVRGIPAPDVCPAGHGRRYWPYAGTASKPVQRPAGRRVGRGNRAAGPFPAGRPVQPAEGRTGQLHRLQLSCPMVLRTSGRFHPPHGSDAREILRGQWINHIPQ